MAAFVETVEVDVEVEVEVEDVEVEVDVDVDDAANLKIGDHLFNPLTNQNIVVSSIKIIKGNFTLYDINTAPVDDYVVNGYLVT